MKKVCTEVRDDYSKYEQLLLGAKLTQGTSIQVSTPKPTHASWKVGRLSVEHIAFPEEQSNLHTEVNCSEEGDESNFKFLLFVSEFMPTPLVNFDSDGGAHRNNFDDVPFPRQQITTPHFNRYNERGHRYAYKSTALANPETACQLTKVNPCIIHFYNEFNLRHDLAGYPQVVLPWTVQHSLFPVQSLDDPLANVTRF